MTNPERLANVPAVRPVWKGPEDPSKQGGVTQSLLGKFLACPQRFKALVIDNLKPRHRFSHRMEYGTMFHLCDEIYQNGGRDWRIDLGLYTEKLLIQYPFDQVDILKWSRVCAIQFPVYLDYWRTHHENVNRTSLLQEEVFHVPYRLPSGRVVYLRGRWDGVELDQEGIWLNESKTKGSVDIEQIQRRLKYDLQTMLYLVALREYGNSGKKKLDRELGREIYLLNGVRQPYPIKGVRYNVVRRPLSGGKGTIKQTKNESVDEYYDRLAQYIKDEPETYFYRWQSEVLPSDIEAFEKNTLIPTLERLCSWYYQYGLGKTGGLMQTSWGNFVMPFGVPHITDEYGSEYDDYIMTGSTVGLEKCTELFTELN